MAIRLGCGSFLIAGIVLELAGTLLAQNSPQQPAPNPIRNSAPAAARQPVDPNLQRGQQSGQAAVADNHGQLAAGAPGNVPPSGAPAQPQPLPVAPPFVLSPQEQADLDALLKKWEHQSESVKVFQCNFQRVEYNPALAGGSGDRATTVSDGEIKFAAPDKGLFRVLNMANFVQDPKTGKYSQQPANATEWWTCDGKSMFQVDTEKKLVTETPLPPQLQGTAITDGPLPFVFGAKADALKMRYFIRVIPPNVANKQVYDPKKQVWIEVLPKLQKDAANFSKVELIFSKDDMQIQAMQIYNPGATGQNLSRTVYTFDKQSINSPWAPLAQLLNNFARPSPIGYTHVLQNPNPAPPPAAPPKANGGQQSGAQASRTQPPRG
jgi:TIGR03009 family protein